MTKKRKGIPEATRVVVRDNNRFMFPRYKELRVVRESTARRSYSHMEPTIRWVFEDEAFYFHWNAGPLDEEWEKSVTFGEFCEYYGLKLVEDDQPDGYCIPKGEADGKD